MKTFEKRDLTKPERIPRWLLSSSEFPQPLNQYRTKKKSRIWQVTPPRVVRGELPFKNDFKYINILNAKIVLDVPRGLNRRAFENQNHTHTVYICEYTNAVKRGCETSGGSFWWGFNRKPTAVSAEKKRARVRGKLVSARLLPREV